MATKSFLRKSACVHYHPGKPNASQCIRQLSAELEPFGASTGWDFFLGAHLRRILDRLNEEQDDQVVLLSRLSIVAELVWLLRNTATLSRPHWSTLELSNLLGFHCKVDQCMYDSRPMCVCGAVCGVCRCVCCGCGCGHGVVHG